MPRKVHPHPSARRFLSVILLLVSVLSSSCGAKSESDPLAYQAGTVSFAVQGEICGIAFSGTLARQSDGVARFCFDTPAALAGVSVRRQEGRTAISLNGTCEADALDGMRPRLLLPLCRGAVISVTREERGRCAVIQTDDGETYTVILGRNNGDSTAIILSERCFSIHKGSYLCDDSTH